MLVWLIEFLDLEEKIINSHKARSSIAEVLHAKSDINTGLTLTLL